MTRQHFAAKSGLIARTAAIWTHDNVAFGTSEQRMPEEAARRFCAEIQTLLDDIDLVAGTRP